MSEKKVLIPGTIIVNANGDTENVFAPKATPPLKNDLSPQVVNLVETLTAAAAGAAVGEIIDAVQANSTRDKVADDRASEAKEPSPFGSINSFGELTRRLGNKDLSKDERSYLEAVRDRAIHDVEDLDEGRYLVRVVDAIERELPNLSWGNEETNRNVFVRLTNTASNLDNQLMMSGGRREWNGIMGQAMEAEIARLRVNGYIQRENHVGDDKDWKFKNRYTNESVERLKETSERLHIFNLLPENAEALVGINIKKEEVAAPVVQPAANDVDESDAYYKAMVKFYGEREPSFQIALREFSKAERLCNFYKAEDHKLVADKIKGEKEREIFEIEFKIFNASLVKRFQGGGSMKGVGENGVLKTISTPEIIELFNSMPGYLEAMRLLAKTIVYRENVGNLNYSFLDVRTQDQFIEVTTELDRIIANKLSDASYLNDEKKFLASRAINTAINTMYAFNVFEFYNTYWSGNIRYKDLESVGIAQAGEEGPTMYDRLVSKPIQDSLCPLDDFINEALKDESKKPANIKGSLLYWANRQMALSGVHSAKDFDRVRVLGYSSSDTRKYFTVEIIGGKRVLLVPPVRQTRLFGSVLNNNKVNLVRGNKKKFIDALADSDEINFQDTGLGSNICNIYTLEAPDLDELKNMFRGSAPKETNDMLKALSTFGQGGNREIIAWLYVGINQLIDSRSRVPKLDKDGLYYTRYKREVLGLYNKPLVNFIPPNYNKFDFVKFMQDIV